MSTLLTRDDLLIKAPDHEALLICLRDWTTQPKVIAAVLREGVLDVDGFVRLALLARDCHRAATLSLPETAAVILAFLARKPIRRVVAHVVSEQAEIPLLQATREVWQLASQLTQWLKVRTHLVVVEGGRVH